MKFEVDRDAFSAALGRAAGVVGGDSAMPILRNILLRTNGEREVELLSTDLELSLRTSVQAVVTEEGQVTIPGKETLAVVRNLFDKSLNVQLKEFKLHMTSGRSRRTLPTLPAEDFPLVSLDGSPDLSVCDKVALARALSAVLYAVPASDDPFSVPGVFINTPGPETYRFAASDGHRLACYDLTAGAMGGLSVGAGIVLPRKAVIEILKLLEREGEVGFAREEKSLLVSSRSALMRCQLLGSEYPDVQSIIPVERPCAMGFDVAEMKRCLKSISVLTDSTWRSVGIAVSDGVVTLSVGRGDTGQAEDELTVDHEGEDFTVHINLKYVQQAVDAVNSDRMRMEWLDHFHGIVFTEAFDVGSLHLVMPMVI